MGQIFASPISPAPPLHGCNMARVVHIAFRLFIVGTIVSVVGCAMLGRIEDKSEHIVRRLSPLAKPRDAIYLDVIYIDRPLSDPMLGKAMWKELDQIGAIDPPTRVSLRRNGFLVGHCSSNPPRKLMSLMNLSPKDGVKVQRVPLESGGDTHIHTSNSYKNCSFALHDSDASQKKEFEDARCVFRVTAQREQDGWARIDFVPEIHFGESSMRHRATNSGWLFQTSQNIEPLYAQKFSMNLAIGEMAVIGADRIADGSVAHRFFIGDAEDRDSQRLLLIRLSRMNKIEPVYSGLD